MKKHLCYENTDVYNSKIKYTFLLNKIYSLIFFHIKI